MIRIILTTSLLVFSTAIVAHELPNTFEAGQPIVANEVNENFAEIESELNQIKSQLGDLNSNERLKVVGSTDPMIFGAIGFSKGTNSCSSKYPESFMCSRDDLYTAGSVATLNTNTLYILRNSSDPICNLYSNRSNNGNNIDIILSDGEGNLGGFLSYGFSTTNNNPPSYEDKYIALANWYENNLTITNSLDDTASTENMYEKYEYSSSTSWGIRPCNTSLPALCCK